MRGSRNFEVLSDHFLGDRATCCHNPGSVQQPRIAVSNKNLRNRPTRFIAWMRTD